MTRRPVLLLLCCALGACAPEPARNLVVVTLDTVRADHLAAYGYQRPTTPALARLAEGAFVFDQAYAQQTNTAPSHGSMFTGLYPHVHGSERNGDPLDEGRVTLTQVLAGRGFRTGGFISGVALSAEGSGLDRGFEVYDEEMRGWKGKGNDAAEKALRWLEGVGPEERFFLFVHLYDAHGPYLLPEGYEGLFESAGPGPLLGERIPPYQRLVTDGESLVYLNPYVDRYDALLRHLDDLVARLLARVDPEKTLFVVLADHGETLGERYHVLDHGAQVFDEQMRIPLLLRAPGREGRRVGQLVETVDLLPTLLELLGVPRPPGLKVQGRSLVPLLDGGRQELHRFVFASARAETSWHADRGYELDEERLIHAVRSRRWKLISYPGIEDDYLELYDLAADPGERRNVAAAHPEVRDALVQLLDRWHAARTAPSPSPDLSPELEEKLRRLGYIGDAD